MEEVEGKMVVSQDAKRISLPVEDLDALEAAEQFFQARFPEIEGLRVEKVVIGKRRAKITLTGAVNVAAAFQLQRVVPRPDLHSENNIEPATRGAEIFRKGLTRPFLPANAAMEVNTIENSGRLRKLQSPFAP